MNKKAIIIGTVSLVAVSAAVYYFFIRSSDTTAAAASTTTATPGTTTASTTPVSTAPTPFEVTSARQRLLALLPNDARFQGLVNALSDTQVIALNNWSVNGQPATWTTDPVLQPVVQAFKNANNYFFYVR